LWKIPQKEEGELLYYRRASTGSSMALLGWSLFSNKALTEEFRVFKLKRASFSEDEQHSPTSATTARALGKRVRFGVIVPAACR
jgi:hypothetical protein